MNKIYLLFLVTSSLTISAQKSKSVLQRVKFQDNSLNLDDNHFTFNKINYDFSKIDIPFSLYHPMPGLNHFRLNSRYYYSMDNTTRLLGIEMKSYEREPVFPDVKKTTLGEAVFLQVMNSLFDK